ncbi:MAG: CvpA family protein [Legionellaceae bacterium]|nr:CvpA family protein [Legionellaceae bacterium]
MIPSTDIIIGSAIGLSMLTGFFRGLIKEMISLAIWVLAAWLGVHYASIPAKWIGAYVQEPRLQYILGFLIILLVVLLIGGILQRLLYWALVKTGLRGTDRVLGMGFGMLRGVLLISLILAVFHKSPLMETVPTDGYLYKLCQPVVTWIESWLPKSIEWMKKKQGGELIAQYTAEE